MKREAMGSTKMKRLCRQLSIPRYTAVGILESLWHLTAREAPQGDIGKLSNEDIALGIEWEGDPDELIEALLVCRWLDMSRQCRIVVHDWHEHCDDATKKKVSRNRLHFLSIPPLSRHVPPSSAVGSLPEPEPVPEPEPEPPPEPVAVATRSASPPALDHVDVARRVGEECRITSTQVLREIQEQAKLDLAEGRVADDIAAEISGSIQAYRAEKPKLRAPMGLEKFIGEGHWRDPTGWPRKDCGDGKDEYQRYLEADA